MHKAIILDNPGYPQRLCMSCHFQRGMPFYHDVKGLPGQVVAFPRAPYFSVIRLCPERGVDGHRHPEMVADGLLNIIPLGSHQFPASEPPGNFFLESHLRHKI